MQKPNSEDINTMTPGKIFQIDPVGTDSLQTWYGGDFVVAEEYMEFGIMGYLSSVYEQREINRVHGVAYVRIPWKLLEYVGNVEWMRKSIFSSEIPIEQSQPPASDP